MGTAMHGFLPSHRAGSSSHTDPLASLTLDRQCFSTSGFNVCSSFPESTSWFLSWLAPQPASPRQLKCHFLKQAFPQQSLYTQSLEKCSGDPVSTTEQSLHPFLDNVPRRPCCAGPSSQLKFSPLVLFFLKKVTTVFHHCQTFLAIRKRLFLFCSL